MTVTLRRMVFGLAAALASVLMAPIGRADTVDQHASSVIGYSSQWSSTSWSAAQALGAPNTFGYGDIASAWAPSSKNETTEHLTLGFSTAVYADGVTIRETDGNGFVRQIDLLDTLNVLHTIWAGTDPSLPGTPVDFRVDWARTDYLVKGVKIVISTNHNLADWEEIDSVQLHGHTEPQMAHAPLPAAAWSGMALLAGLGLRRLLGRAAA